MRVVPGFVQVAVAPVSIAALGTLGSLAGCSPDLGSCDMTVATQVVYSAQGTPYYAGQALVQQSCADGVCHAETAVNDARKGAPHGLNFDVAPIGSTAMPANIAALRDGIAVVRDNAGDMYDEIEAGTMPPGAAGQRQPLSWKLANGSVATLPTIETADGKATVQNWLACGAPLIAGFTRTGMAASPEAAAIGAVLPAIESGMAGSSFTEIYSQSLAPCASACHKIGGAYPLLDLGSQAAAHAALVGKDPSAMGTCGGKGKLVTPGNCETSLLYTKLLPNPTCGLQMPFGAEPLSKSATDAICTWIKAGAPAQ